MKHIFSLGTNLLETQLLLHQPYKQALAMLLPEVFSPRFKALQLEDTGLRL